MVGCSAVDANPRSLDHDFSFDVRVIEQSTNQHPARISIQLGYDGESPVMLRGGPELPFSNTGGRHVDGDSNLVMFPIGSAHYARLDDAGPVIPSEPVDGCWRIDYGTQRNAINVGEELRHGDVISTDYALLDSNDEGPCFPQGTYEFSSTQDLYPETSTDETKQNHPLELRFSLSIDASKKPSVEDTGLAIRSDTAN